jgi:putative hydrolase of the HAD superfamily
MLHTTSDLNPTPMPAASGRPYDTLLLDFGGVCLLNPVELHAHVENELGLPAGTFEWMGPVDPETDELWRRMVAGDGLSEREYWHQRAADVGRAAGREMTLHEYMRLLYVPPHADLVRPEAEDVVARAFQAGLGVSVLTNDLRAFHGPEWEHGIALLRRMDHIVDCSDTHILKPDPRAFERAVQITGVAADRLLFVDDQPLNVEGARGYGIDAVWFDVAHPLQAWAEIAARLGL